MAEPKPRVHAREHGTTLLLFPAAVLVLMLLAAISRSSISVPVSLCAGHVGRRTCRRPTRFRAGLRLPRWEDSVWWGYGVQVMSDRPFAALVT